MLSKRIIINDDNFLLRTLKAQSIIFIFKRM